MTLSEKQNDKMKEITIKSRNFFRIKKIIETEMLIAQAEYNVNRRWWNFKKFDYDIFVAGFLTGMDYLKRITKGEILEHE